MPIKWLKTRDAVLFARIICERLGVDTNGLQRGAQLEYRDSGISSNVAGWKDLEPGLVARGYSNEITQGPMANGGTGYLGSLNTFFPSQFSCSLNGAGNSARECHNIPSALYELIIAYNTAAPHSRDPPTWNRFRLHRLHWGIKLVSLKVEIRIALFYRGT
jgi:hypothetical protein